MADPLAAVYVRLSTPLVACACGHHPGGNTDPAAPESIMMGYGMASYVSLCTPLNTFPVLPLRLFLSLTLSSSSSSALGSSDLSFCIQRSQEIVNKKAMTPFFVCSAFLSVFILLFLATLTISTVYVITTKCSVQPESQQQNETIMAKR